MNTCEEQGTRVPDGESQLGPVAHKRPGPSRLDNETQEVVIRGLDSAIKQAREGVQRFGAGDTWVILGALCYLNGYLQRNEPAIAARLATLVEVCK